MKLLNKNVDAEEKISIPTLKSKWSDTDTRLNIEHFNDKEATGIMLNSPDLQFHPGYVDNYKMKIMGLLHCDDRNNDKSKVLAEMFFSKGKLYMTIYSQDKSLKKFFDKMFNMVWELTLHVYKEITEDSNPDHKYYKFEKVKVEKGKSETKNEFIESFFANKNGYTKSEFIEELGKKENQWIFSSRLIREKIFFHGGLSHE